MPKTIDTRIMLDEALHVRLLALSTARGCAPDGLMKAAIAEYVEREEAFESEKREDLARWENYQITGHAIPNETADAWLASWGSESELPCPK